MSQLRKHPYYWLSGQNMFNWTTRMFQVSAMCRTQEIIIQRNQENNHEPKPQDATSKNNKRHSNNQPRQLWFLKLSTFNTLWNRQKKICAFAEQARGIVGHLCGENSGKNQRFSKQAGQCCFCVSWHRCLERQSMQRWQDLLCVKVSCK